LSHSATLRFPSPLIEPDVPISGTRLSDWLHREAHVGALIGANKWCLRARIFVPFCAEEFLPTDCYRARKASNPLANLGFFW
jgi:hypothetical protein